MQWMYYALLGLLCWGLFQLGMKLVSDKMDSVSSMFIFQLFALLFMLLIMGIYIVIDIKQQYQFPKNATIIIAIAGSLAALGNFLIIKALSKAPASRVWPIVNLAIIIPVLVGFLALKEPFSLRLGVGVVLAIISIILISMG